MQYAVNQYEMLREQIMKNMSTQQNLITTTYGIVGAILAIIFSIQNINTAPFTPIMLFTPIFLMLVLFSMRLNALVKNNLLISAYMEVFLEPHLDGIKWESKIFLKQKMRNKVSPPEVYSVHVVVTFAVFILFLITFFFECYHSFGSWGTFILNVVAVFLVCFFMKKGEYSYKSRDKHVAAWISVKAKNQTYEVVAKTQCNTEEGCLNQTENAEEV